MHCLFSGDTGGGSGLKLSEEKLNLSHRELLNERLKQINLKISEYSFANLYLFRGAHDYTLLFDNEDIYIKGISYSGVPYIMPCREIRAGDMERIKLLMKGYGDLFPVPEAWLGCFDPGEFDITFDQGESDYISLIDDIKTYSGKKLHNKKNLLNQFESLYKHEALPLTNDRIGDAMEILDKWQEGAGAPAETDYFPCREGLELYEELELCGGIFYADGKAAGFILGEEINRSIFALHFAKGIPGIKGLYQYMYNRFAMIMPEKYCCFNFEQDLGLESLRRAKSSYKTSELIKKYRVRLKQKN